MRLEAIDRQQKTAHFVGSEGKITITAERLRGLFDQVMGGLNDRGEYKKDLRSVKDEVRAGVHNEVLSDPLERAVIYFYASNLLSYLRVSWFNLAGSAITDEDVKRLDGLYASGEQPQETDGDQVKTWFGVYSLKKLLEEQNS